jgi:hypothetical protein
MTGVVAVVPSWFNADCIAGNEPQRHDEHDAGGEPLIAAIGNAVNTRIAS